MPGAEPAGQAKPDDWRWGSQQGGDTAREAEGGAASRALGSPLGAHPRLPALDVRRRSRERWRPWARTSASCLCFSSSSLARTSSSPHRSEEKWVGPRTLS